MANSVYAEWAIEITEAYTLLLNLYPGTTIYQCSSFKHLWTSSVMATSYSTLNMTSRAEAEISQVGILNDDNDGGVWTLALKTQLMEWSSRTRDEDNVLVMKTYLVTFWSPSGLSGRCDSCVCVQGNKV